ncbi:MAG: hypothetical protein PHG67_09090 [Bacteroidales bacterium]|nr:hypothetical protein [Bacteroidales bacterium]HOI32356.1 hypothetical protein [Bacteroidales bacterium]
MTGASEILATNSKALQINLDSSIYGSFAEIGGGQEVARNFFHAGGASGTIAKTISAYDKSYSDAIYCKDKSAKRYVSRERLLLMLDAEYEELTRLLQHKVKSETRFFTFADTVSTLNFFKDNVSHGWMGVRFQLCEGSDYNQVILHVRLLENDNVLQQNTLGILGVNLIYACFYLSGRPNAFLQSLMDNLSSDRLAITMIHMSGPELNYVDNRLLGVQLVKNGMTKAIMFDRYGDVQEPDDMLYKKNVLLFRGSFRPVTYVTTDMLKTSYSLFKKDEDYDKSNTLSLCEITLNNLFEKDDFDERDFLERVDLLNEMGQHVMVSNFREFYKLVSYLSQFRTIKLRLVIGLDTFEKVMDESYYTDLKGGILEALGKLFPINVKVYLYPVLNPKNNKQLQSQDLKWDVQVKYLYQHLLENRKIIDIRDAQPHFLSIRSHEVLELLRLGDPSWESQVPVFIAKRIKARKLFGYSE